MFLSDSTVILCCCKEGDLQHFPIGTNIQIFAIKIKEVSLEY